MALYSHAAIRGQPRSSVLKVTTFSDFLKNRFEPEQCAIWIDSDNDLTKSRALEDVRWGALISKTAVNVDSEICFISDAKDWSVVNTGNVIALRPRTGVVSSLYRRGSKSNALLVTERCNSYCVMCSQPPVDREDSGRITELLSVIRLIDKDETRLGFTGGEPTLLGEDLLRLFEECRVSLPNTNLHVLSNGRRFADRKFAEAVVSAAPNALWGIPLYSDSPDVHDFVVQRKGAFSETLQGLWNLAGLGAHVELRVVLQRAVIPRLDQLAHFISRNLSFVDHVAWMGLEPMGFAKPNWGNIWTDPAEYSDSLTAAVERLDRFGVPTSIFNVPLCVLPPVLRPYAVQSISDWKNAYLESCNTCGVKNECGGFFASITEERVPRNVRPLASMADDNASISL